MRDEVAAFRLSSAVKSVVDLNRLLAESRLEFDSQANLAGTAEPVMILHAKDDWMVPYELGTDLNMFRVL